MTDLFGNGDGILFMKVGTHANESLEDIIARKKLEIETAGFADGLQPRDQVGNVFHLTKGRDDDAYR